MPFLREYLINTNMNFGFVKSAKEVLEKGADQYALLFLCLDLEDMTGPEFTKYLRENNYHNPIILAGQAEDELTKQQIRLSNADMFLSTPLTEKSVMCALGEFLLTKWSQDTLEALRSGVDIDTVKSICTELTKLGILLEQQIHSDDPIKVYGTCTKIRSLAPLLGMKELRDLTLQVGEKIAASGDLHQFDKELKSIMTLCKSTKQAA